MTLELTVEEARYIYNILKSGIYFPDEEQNEFLFNLKKKFIID